MRIKIYQVDAFTDKLFGGNPAAVCPLDKWPDDELLQQIAMENNLAETAFYVKHKNHYDIRWMTPTVEVDLCGHATLAAAHVLFNYENHKGNEIVFKSQRSGNLLVTKEGDFLTLNFPSDIYKSIPVFPELIKGLNATPTEVLKGKTDYIAEFENEDEIKNIRPNFRELVKIECRGVIVMAKGDDVDFVSRFFAPQSGIDEDPVTGSAHTSLTPYWADKLGKKELTAKQISKRGGYLKCKYLGERVAISGQCSTYLKGEIKVKRK